MDNHQINKIINSFPDLNFIANSENYWAPETQTIFYVQPQSDSDLWAVLHEIGHALLNHTSYKSDFDLLKKEVDAWEKAKLLAARFSMHVNSNHIQDCLDTYREWIYQRSSCPKCNTKGIQQTSEVYTCINCQNTWRVTYSRTCRHYRRNLIKSTPQTKSRL